MKIDEACIEHNVCYIAQAESSWIIDCSIDDEIKMQALLSLAKISGACEMADRLKEVLKQ